MSGVFEPQEVELKDSKIWLKNGVELYKRNIIGFLALGIAMEGVAYIFKDVFAIGHVLITFGFAIGCIMAHNADTSGSTLDEIKKLPTSIFRRLAGVGVLPYVVFGICLLFATGVGAIISLGLHFFNPEFFEESRQSSLEYQQLLAELEYSRSKFGYSIGSALGKQLAFLMLPFASILLYFVVLMTLVKTDTYLTLEQIGLACLKNQFLSIYLFLYLIAVGLILIIFSFSSIILFGLLCCFIYSSYKHIWHNKLKNEESKKVMNAIAVRS
jgi:hypothetical protein